MADTPHLGPEILGDYAEGLLDPAARSEADRHLQGCEACRRELDTARAYFGEMAALPVHRAPDRFLTHVHARIAKASPWRRFFAILSSPRLLPVPLAAVTVIGVGLYFSHMTRTDMTPQAQVSYAPAAPAPVEQADKEALAEAPAAKDVPIQEPPSKVAAAKPAGNAAQVPPLIERQAAKGEARAEKPSEESFAMLEKKLNRASKTTSTEPTRLAGRRALKASDDFAEGETVESLGALADNRSVPKRKAGKQAEQPSRSVGGDGSPQAGAGPIAGGMDPGSAVAMAPKPAPAPPATTPVPPARPKTEEAAKADHAARADKTPAAVALAVPAAEPPREMVDSEDDADVDAAPSRPASGRAKESAVAAKSIPLGYAVYIREGHAGLDRFEADMKTLGIRVIARRDGGFWDLEVPATRIAALETHLRGLGRVEPSANSIPGPKDGAPIKLSVRLLRTAPVPAASPR